MPYLVIVIDVTKGRLVDIARHDAELSAILQQSHSTMVMRATPQALFDSDRVVVGEVRFQENPPGRLHAMEAEQARQREEASITAAEPGPAKPRALQGDAKAPPGGPRGTMGPGTTAS